MDQRTPQTSSARVNGEAVRRFRHQAGFSQEVLARRAGYSDKLIRKAEASGTLWHSTIRDLAGALTTADQTVTAYDLLFQAECVPSQLLRWIGSTVAMNREQLGSLITVNSQMVVAGSRRTLPFAGSYRGIQGALRFHRKWSAYFDSIRLASDSISVFVNGSECCVNGSFDLRAKTTAAGSVWVFLRVDTKDHKATRAEFYFDTSAVEQLLARPQASDGPIDRAPVAR